MELVTNEKLEEILDASPAPRVNKEGIISRIKDVKFHKLGPTLTHCTILLDNNYSVTGESACVNVANYNQKIGEKIAYDNAFGKLWALYGFLLAEDNLRTQVSQEATNA